MVSSPPHRRHLRPGPTLFERASGLFLGSITAHQSGDMEIIARSRPRRWASTPSPSASTAGRRPDRQRADRTRSWPASGVHLHPAPESPGLAPAARWRVLAKSGFAAGVVPDDAEPVRDDALNAGVLLRLAGTARLLTPTLSVGRLGVCVMPPSPRGGASHRQWRVRCVASLARCAPMRAVLPDSRRWRGAGGSANRSAESAALQQDTACSTSPLLLGHVAICHESCG